MKWTKVLAAALSGIITVTVAGCGSGADTTATSTAQAARTLAESGSDLSGKTIGVLVVTTQSQWCNDIISGVTEIADQNGDKVIVSDSQVSVDNELSGMENLINSGVDAIVVNAMNAAGLSDLCKQAREKGIYVIGWSELLGNYDALVTEDYDEEANMMADAIGSYIDEKGVEKAEMAEIWLADAANPDTNAGIFKAALESAFDRTLVTKRGVNVINSQYASDSATAMNQGEAILAANPDVKVIFTQSDEMGVAVSQAISAKGIDADQIMVCGLDGTDEAIKAIASGSSPLKATIYADAQTLGKNIGNSIMNFFSTGNASDVETVYTLIDQSNASQYVK